VPRLIDGWWRLKLDIDDKCILLGVLRSKSVRMARIIAIRRFERRETGAEEENLLVGIGSQEERRALALRHPCSLQSQQRPSV
jgi:hypothetical protein